jgi:hypothetical protein
MRALVLASMLIIGWSSGAWAADKKAKPAIPLPPFEFRGHMIGEPIETNYLNWEYKPNENGALECFKDDFEIIHCNDPTVQTSPDYRNHKTHKTTHYRRLGDVSIEYLTYGFFDGKLALMTMEFENINYIKIREMTIGKFGEPKREKIEKTQNTMGASFDNLTSEWDFREGVLSLRQRANRIDTGMLKFTSTEADAEITKRMKQKNQEKGRSSM